MGGVDGRDAMEGGRGVVGGGRNQQGNIAPFPPSTYPTKSLSLASKNLGRY